MINCHQCLGVIERKVSFSSKFHVSFVLIIFSCCSYQSEIPQFLHMGEIIDGVDMRAEVGILTRNIVIQGEMEDSCYAENQCQFFDYDTFGGHVMVGERI